MSDEIRVLQEYLRTHFDPTLSVDGQSGPRTKKAIAQFQLAFTGGSDGGVALLTVDGVAGPKTMAAIAASGPDGYASKHFRFYEFRDRETGHVFISRTTVAALEIVRTKIGRPIRIVSGSRTRESHRRLYARLRQRVVWGSWHLKRKVPGLVWEASYAVDIDSASTRINKDWLRRQGIFSGIGWNRSTHFASHLDTRYNRSKLRPAMWSYNR